MRYIYPPGQRVKLFDKHFGSFVTKLKKQLRTSVSRKAAKRAKRNKVLS